MRTWLPWRTIETEHFAFHYPVELEAWTRDVARRMEAIDSAVSSLVGYRPSRKADVIVDDPYVTPNGSAWPFLNRPVINFWATPPDPREDIGTFRVWGDMLATHEFAHIAHLVRPSRNPRSRWVWSVLPANLGPIARKAPRWAIEGYATFVEGRLTGSGRPHGPWRAAFLRQWAIEGALPNYSQLDSWSAYAGGEFAYLAGSAYLEWLGERNGDSSLVHVWRRLSARRNRSFDDAFAGVFGESPSTLYQRFIAELTAKSMAAARTVARAEADTGAIIQRLSWDTGDPAISPDGERAAVVIRSATRPSRLVVWKTAAEPDTMRPRRDSALVKADPEDVPARPIYPPPKKVLATLRAVGGMSFQGPRFFQDGRILLWRMTAAGDGTLAPDLFVWNTTAHSVRRVTHGARVRNGDPSPDGRRAVAERCRGGHCDVVLVDLVTGVVTAIQEGDTHRSFYRPRWSPDGHSVVVSMHAADRWRLQIIDVADRTARFVDPEDGANRYDATYLAPNILATVSDAGGIANIELLDLVARRTRTLTQVTGAAVAPAVNPADQSIWFLSLYSKGYDIRRIDARRQDAVVAALPDSLAPAAPPRAGDSSVFAAGPVGEPRPYSVGTRVFRWLPAPQWAADGKSGVIALVSSDVIGRTELLGQFAIGERGMWRGGSVAATWRGAKSPVRLSVFDAAQWPSRNSVRVPVPAVLDVRLSGGLASIEATNTREETQKRLRITGSLARYKGHSDSALVARPGTNRHLLVVDAATSWQRRFDVWRLSAGLVGNFTYGRSGDRPLRRFLGGVNAGLSAGGPLGVAGSARLGDVNPTADPFELFTLGGSPSPLIDESLLSQRVTMAAIPTGADAGPKLFAYRLSIPLAPVSPFLWAATTTRTDGRFENWHRVLGAELSISVPHIAFAGTPAARAQIGFGRSLDAPYARKTRGYVNLIFP